MEEIVRRVRGEVVLGGKRDRELEREATRASREIYTEVQLARMEVDGAMVIAEHIMDRAVQLNRARRILASEGDPALELELADIFGTAMHQAKALQRQLYRGW